MLLFISLQPFRNSHS